MIMTHDRLEMPSFISVVYFFVLSTIGDHNLDLAWKHTAQTSQLNTE